MHLLQEKVQGLMWLVQAMRPPAVVMMCFDDSLHVSKNSIRCLHNVIRWYATLCHTQVMDCMRQSCQCQSV